MKLSVLTVTQDRRIVKGNKKSFVEWICEVDKQVGWFILRRLFVTNKYFKGKTGLVLDSGYAIPLSPYNDYTDEELKELTNLDKRAAQALNIAVGEAEKEGRQNIIARTIQMAVFGLVFCVILLVILVAKGRM